MISAFDLFEMRRDVQYAEHEGSALLGDFYLPKGASKVPVLIAVHGGGWAHRSRRTYQYWGPFLAKHNYAVFEIAYRIGTAGMYPRSVYDVKSAVQFVRALGGDYGIDPDAHRSRRRLGGRTSCSAGRGYAADEFRDADRRRSRTRTCRRR